MNHIRTSMMCFLALSVSALVGCQPQAVDLGHSMQPEIDKTLKAPSKQIKLADKDHLALLQEGMKWYKANNITNYTCTFIKEEQLASGRSKRQTTNVKFLANPFSVAMVWTKNAPLADRILYVAGKYPDKTGKSQMLARPASSFFRALVGGSVKKLPDGKDAMKNTLRPVTMFGLKNSLQSLIDVYAAALAKGKKECIMKFGGMTKIADRPCIVLIRILPNKAPGYPSKTTYICLDTETRMPLQIVGYDWEDKFQCFYQYQNIKFNPGLTEKDFTPKANEIAAPKK